MHAIRKTASSVSCAFRHLLAEVPPNKISDVKSLNTTAFGAQQSNDGARTECTAYRNLNAETVLRFPEQLVDFAKALSDCDSRSCMLT